MLDEEVFVDLGLSKREATNLVKRIDVEQEDLLKCPHSLYENPDESYLVVTSDEVEISCEDCIVDDLKRSRNIPKTWVKGVFLIDELSTFGGSEPEQCSCGDDAKYRVDITHLGTPDLSCEDCFIANFKQLRDSPEEIISVELIDGGDSE